MSKLSKVRLEYLIKERQKKKTKSSKTIMLRAPPVLGLMLYYICIVISFYSQLI